MADEKFCVVCGAGSHRDDWQKQAAPACDFHKKEEVASAVQAQAQAKAKAAAGAAAQKPAN